MVALIDARVKPEITFLIFPDEIGCRWRPAFTLLERP
jgi:hypothetical protein